MSPKAKPSGGLVWSSDPSRTVRCSHCGEEPCVCPASVYPPLEQQMARLLRSRAGRGGKTVVVIEGLRLSPEGYRKLASRLCKALGTGGTVKDATIEIQGDLRDRAADTLRTWGCRVKLIGG